MINVEILRAPRGWSERCDNRYAVGDTLIVERFYAVHAGADARPHSSALFSLILA